DLYVTGVQTCALPILCRVLMRGCRDPIGIASRHPRMRTRHMSTTTQFDGTEAFVGTERNQGPDPGGATAGAAAATRGGDAPTFQIGRAACRGTGGTPG